VASDSVLTISGCTFRQNESEEVGGAIYIFNGKFEISDCLFLDNDAGVDAGFLYGLGGAAVVSMSSGTFTGCTFALNRASLSGGAILSGDGDLDVGVVNCSFHGNSAPQGSGILIDQTNLTITNSIIAFGMEGAAVTSLSASTPFVGCTNIYGNAGGDWIGCLSGLQDGPTNISADPQFCDAEHGDFTLTASSPCAPFSPPNQYCDQVGAWPVGCDYGPAITSVADVAGDQGRHVRVSWTASPQDAWGTPYTVAQYSLWRRVDGRAAGDAAPRGDRFPPGYWDYVTSIPARVETDYSVVCETLCDSTIADGLCESSFFVSAETDQMPIFFDSPPDSGYSVDNLSPAAPLNFRMESTTLLAWDKNTDADFDYFTLYGSSVDLLDESAVLIGHTTGTDYDITGEGHAYYLLTAADFSGNESPEAVLADESVSAPDGLPTAVALRAAYPNPFNPHTEIRFELPEAASVKLMIYDVGGRLVRTLLDGEPVAAGRHAATWRGRDDRGRELSSGIYFTRFEAAGEQHTGKLTLLR